MNLIEKVLMHALFVHLHHNTDQAVDFGLIEELNRKVGQAWPGALLIGPGDDAAVFRFPGIPGSFVGKMESHCSPCVPRPKDAAATGAGGAIRDVTAMGGRAMFLLNFIGTRPMEKEVLVGPCGFKGACDCGNCLTMTSKERVDLMMEGMRQMCETLDVFIVGGGFSTSFSDIVPALVVAVIGKLIIEQPLTKPAKKAGDNIILIGVTGNDGNDSLFRAGAVKEMRPALALFEEERITMEATLAAFATGKINACSDLGAAGIGAGVCESARYGGFGAEVDLSLVPVNDGGVSAQETLICETQARMLVQVSPDDAEEVLVAARLKGGTATIIGEINGDNKQVFGYGGETIAVIPNNPSREILAELQG